MKFQLIGKSATLCAIFILALFNSKVIGQTQSVWLTLINPDDLFDETVIALTTEATDTFDVLYDSPKLRDSSDIYIYSIIDSGAYLVQALSPLSIDKTVALGIDATLPGMYLMQLANVEYLDESVAIVLEDTHTGISTNLRKDPNYWFNLVAGVGIERFRLHLNTPINISTVDGKCDGTPSMLQINQLGNYTWDYEIRNENNDLIDASASWNGVQSLFEIPTGTYTISFTDQYGYSFIKQVSLSDKEAVVAQFQVSDSITSTYTPVYFFDYSVGASNYVWDFGDGNIQTGTPFPLNVFTQAGVYEVKFTAANNECQDVSTKTIEVLNYATGISDGADIGTRIHSSGKQLFIDIAQSRAIQIKVFNLMGQMIYNEISPVEGKLKISLPISGFYIVSILADGKYYNTKVFLQ